MREGIWAALAGVGFSTLAAGAVLLARAWRQSRELEMIRRRNAQIEAANAERVAAHRAAMAERTRCVTCSLPRQLNELGICRVCQHRACLNAYKAAQSPPCVSCGQSIPIDSQTHYCGRCLAQLLARSQPPQLPAPASEFAELDALLKRHGL